MSSESRFMETEVGIIPSDWRIEKLRNLCTKIGSGATPRGGSNIYVQSGTALIRSQNVHDNGFDKHGLAFIDDDEAEKLSNVEVKSHDVLLNITGDSICRTSIVPDEILPARVNQHVSILRANEKLYYRFLFFYLNLAKAKRKLLSYDAGGTRQAITKGMLEEFCIPLPKYDEQVRIGDNLWTLTEKIDTNRSTNAILEKMGKTIFKHWFVDFEFPNEGGKPYKSSGGEMADSELGKMPKGWEVRPLSGVIAVNPSRELAKGTPAKKIGMTDLGPWQSWIVSWQLDEYKSGPRFQNGDTLFARITPSLEHGKTAFVSCLGPNEVAFGSTEFIILAPKTILSSQYVFHLARSEYVREAAISAMTGSSGRQRVPEGLFDHLMIHVPPQQIVEEFHAIVTPLFDAIAIHAKQNRILGSIRDAILPKLMSGEIRVCKDNQTQGVT